MGMFGRMRREQAAAGRRGPELVTGSVCRVLIAAALSSSSSLHHVPLPGTPLAPGGLSLVCVLGMQFARIAHPPLPHGHALQQVLIAW